MDKHLNGDEASVLGSTYIAASHSSSLKVREFRIKDITPFSFGVNIHFEAKDKYTQLFKSGQRLGSKKSITLSTNENITVSLEHEKNSQYPLSR